MKNESGFMEEMERKRNERAQRLREQKKRELGESLARSESYFEGYLMGGSTLMTIWVSEPGIDDINFRHDEVLPEKFFVCATPFHFDFAESPPRNAETRHIQDNLDWEIEAKTHWVELRDLLRGYASNIISGHHCGADEANGHPELKARVRNFLNYCRHALDEIERDLPAAIDAFSDRREGLAEALGFRDDPGGDDDAA